jgi:hypothetical protein
MRGGVFSKNIGKEGRREGAKERASERRNENLIVSGTLKNKLNFQ